MKKCYGILIFLMFPLFLLADSAAPILVTVPVPLETVFDQIIALIKGWGGMTKPALASAIIVIIISLFKSNLVGEYFKTLSPLWKRLIIGILGLAASAVMQISGGMTVSSAIYGALIISGGAVLIFETIVSVLPDAGNKFKFLLTPIIWIMNRFKKMEPPTEL